MTYYIFIEDGKVNGAGQCPITCDMTEMISYEVSEELYNDFNDDPDKYTWDGEQIIENPNYEEVKRQKERQRLDALTLTPADVERALYKAKQMDFDDLKALIVQTLPTIDIKALSIEFRAKDFYRGAEANGMRLFDTVGALLGYSSDDMDYLFQNKELPSGETLDVDTTQ
jgi:hypothetical protein